MALNYFTNKEAIEIAMQIRDRLELDFEKDLKERWIEKDALAQIINLAENYPRKILKFCEEKLASALDNINFAQASFYTEFINFIKSLEN